MDSGTLSDFHLDVLKEVSNIGAGNAATSLSSLLGRTVDMQVSRVVPMPFNGIVDYAGGAERMILSVFVRIEGGISGNMLFVMSTSDALALIRASEFGNGACIFTQNSHYVETFSREADVGMVGVNVGICAPHPYAPFGRIKGSLLGTDKVQGRGGIDFFTQEKVTTLRTFDPKGKRGAAAPKAASVRSCVAS